MEAVRDKWTDERLDDLNAGVDRGFDRVDADIRAFRMEMRTEFTTVRAEMKSEFTAVRAEMRTEFAAVRAEMRAEFTAVRGEMRTEFAAVRAEMKAGFEATQRLIIQVGGGMIGTMIFGFAALLVS